MKKRLSTTEKKKKVSAVGRTVSWTKGPDLLEEGGSSAPPLKIKEGKKGLRAGARSIESVCRENLNHVCGHGMRVGEEVVSSLGKK